MRTILIIEDDEAILSTYAFALEKEGYRALTAADGEVGLELARRHLPDLIICDLNMPRQDGWATLGAVREDSELAATQVVLMTGNRRDAKPRVGMELGADDFLIKPVAQEELLRCVRARLRRAGIHRRLSEQAVAELRTNFHFTLPHEFFTPLAGILGLVEVLQSEGQGLEREETAELLEEIRQSGWRLHRTLRNYLLAIDLESKSDPNAHPATASPDQVLQAARSSIDVAASRHQRTADVETRLRPCALSCSKDDVGFIVEELVDNACAYSRSGTPVRVDLDASGILSVTDQGRGLTEAQISQIGAFQQFDRKKFEQQGLGLGLYLAQKLAARCAASFDIQSVAGKGTRVRVSFKALGPQP